MKNLILVFGLVAFAGCGSGVNGSSGAAACATAATCGILGAGVSECTFSVEQVNDPTTAANAKINAAQVNCIAAAGANCPDARKCLNDGNAPTACTGSSQSCNGTVWNSCDAATGTGGNNGTRQYDCASEGSGETCVTANGTTDCGSGSCSGFITACSGNVLQTCAGGIQRNSDCSRSGSTCEPGGLLGPHCRGTGATCSGTGALRCDGKVLVSCTDGQEARQDCTVFNLGCFGPPPGGSGYSCALGSDCTALSTAATCEGNILHFCNKGKFDTLNCGANGFTGCDATAGGRCKTATP